ncbi:MAG TPA: glycoside hydrolase family 16 protein, partial [Anaerolineales bacterium]|nr:glycoside hydrolase family 16 protein [Anaerolineales bacterium]
MRTNTIVSDAAGGEVRLAALLEDYFSGSAVDTARWVSGSTYTWYQVPPSVSGGVLTLDSAYLRSQTNFQNVVPRFFEARALQRINTNAASWPDLGFYRELPPLDYGSGPYPNDSSLRIFVTRDTNTTYVRGRDGDGTQPLIDVDIPTLDLQQYHLFRIEWDATETRFYTDGTLRATIPGIATLNTWAFLYSQDPATGGRSPMQVDWVRVGQYASTGTYQSCALDAGSVVDWAEGSW